jgi:putative tricarboxylic transport membrane protein
MTRRASMDTLIGAGLLVLAGGIVAATRGFPASAPGTPGPELFPLLLAGLGALVGAGLIVASLRGRMPLPETAGPRAAAWRMPALLGAVVAYTLAMPAVGFITTSTLLLAGLMFLLGYRHKARAFALGLSLALVVHGLFAGLMNVPLPAGWLG